MTLYKNIKPIKRGAALFLSCLIFWQHVIPNTIYAKSTNDDKKCSITEEEILSSVQEALKKNKTQDKNKFEFSGDYSEDYEELFGLYDDSDLYKLNISGTKSVASGSSIKKEKVTAYLELNGDEDSPDESKIIFIAQNTTKKTKKYAFNLMGQDVYVSVPSKASIASEDPDKDDTASVSNVQYTAAASEITASPSDIDNIEVNDTLDFDIDFYEPVLLNEKATVAFSISADDFVEKASKTEYKYETDSAVIAAFAPEDAFDEKVTLEARELDEDEEDSISEMLHAQNKLFAGKKTFDIHFINDDGDEIEPNSEVEVTIKLKDSELSENIDPDSFTVFHMSDKNAMNGTSAIELCELDDVNDEFYGSSETEKYNLFDELQVNTVKKDNVFETTFTTDSFSYFILSYNSYNQVYAYLYDEDNNPLPGDELQAWQGSNKYNPVDFCANWLNGYGSADSKNKWISIHTLTDVFGSKTAGYNYVDAYTDSAMTESFNWIYFKKSSYSNSGTWWVSTSEDKPSSAPSSSDGTSRTIVADTTDNVMKLYIKFKNDTTVSDLEDDVESDGYFLAKTPEDISEYATLNYKWYRSDDGETYEEVVKKKTAKTAYNIEVDTTGSKLYPSRDITVDETVRRWYKAELYVDGELYKTYSPIQVQDYPSIMNGSFETPDTSLIDDTTGYTFPNGTNGLYWQTSASDKQIEIVRTGSSAESSYGCASAADGNQWAELNAESRGALYQHVLVQPGSTLYWSFSHRGRSGNENMYMVITPKSLVNSDSSTSELVTIAQSILNGDTGYTEDDGFYAKSVTDGTSSWVTYDGSYTVPDDVWMLSFFFISNSGSTMGNMIDNVSLSTKVPDPEKGYANITAKETVTGLRADDVNKLSMHVWLEDKNGNIVTDKNGTKAEKTVKFSEVIDDKGAYTKTVTFLNVADNTEYTIQKELYFDGSTTVPDNYTKTEETYSVYRNDVLEENGDGKKATFTPDDGARDKITAAFNDVFETDFVPVTVSKKLLGNAADADEDFRFTVSGTLRDGNEITNEISDEDKVFTLKGDEEKTISVPYGSTVTIAEDDYTEDKYTTYYEIVPGDVTKGREVMLPYVTMDKEIVFTNKRIKYTVTIQKVDEKGNRLKDAELAVKTTGLTNNTTVATTKTSDTSDWEVDIAFGDYVLTETTAPNGYSIADAISFNVDETGVVTSDVEGVVSITDDTNYIITMVDELLPGTVTIENSINEKYYPFGTSSFIYEIVNEDNTYKKVAMLTMENLKESTTISLPKGNYTIKQIPVARYNPEAEEINITVTNGTAVTASFKNTITQYEMFSHVTGIINEIKEKVS